MRTTCLKYFNGPISIRFHQKTLYERTFLGWCNWQVDYNDLERLIIMQKKLVRIVICSPYYANKILNIKDINFYVVSIFMYNWLSSRLPGILTDFCVPNNEFQRHGTRNTNEMYVSFARLDIRKLSVRIYGPNSWNALQNVVNKSASISTFKYGHRNHIVSLKCCDENSQT